MGLCKKGKINDATFKMADNHLRSVYMHHQAKHDGIILPYFDFSKKKGVWRHIGKFESKKGKAGGGTWRN